MKSVYSAQNSIEAHMIVNLLKQYGLHGNVMGDYLQGGMGEIPSVNMIQVMVPTPEYERARTIIADYDSARPLMPDPDEDSAGGN